MRTSHDAHPEDNRCLHDAPAQRACTSTKLIDRLDDRMRSAITAHRDCRASWHHGYATAGAGRHSPAKFLAFTLRGVECRVVVQFEPLLLGG